MPKYTTTLNGREVTFEAANDEAAQTYIDKQLANKPDKAPDDVGNKLRSDVASLLAPGDTPEKARIEGEIAGRNASQGTALGLSLQQGTMRNLMDEGAGLSAASGLPVGTPPGWSIPIGAARIGIGKLTGNEGPSNDYAKETARMRGFYEAMEKQNPMTTLGGEVVGGSAGYNPAGRVANVVVNAVDAGVSGFGAGESAESRGLGAATGAGVAGTISAAIPFATNRLAALYRGVRGLIGGEAGERLARKEAVERAANAFGRDIPRITDEERAIHAFADTTGQSQEKVIADYGGETVRDLVRSSTNQSSDAQRVVKDVVDPRYASQADRVSDIVDSQGGQANAHQRRLDLEVQARNANAPRYDAAYNSPRAASVWSPELQQLTTSDTVRTAINDAARTSSDVAALGGQRQAVRNPFTVGADGTLQLPPGQTPTLEFWDHVQRNLREMEEKAGRSDGPAAASRIGALRRQLNDHLDTQVPEFRTARAGAATAFGAQDALEAGTMFLKGKGNANEAKAALAQMTLPERMQFQEGMTDTIRAEIRNLKDGRDVAKLFNSPELRERLVLGLGSDGADALQRTLRVERGMNDLKAALGNSTTVKQLIGAGLVGGGAGAGMNYLEGGDLLSGTGVSTSTLTAALAVGLKAGNNRLNESVARRTAELLMSQDPADMRLIATAMSNNHTLRNAVTGFFDRVSAVTGQQAGGYVGEGQR